MTATNTQQQLLSARLGYFPRRAAVADLVFQFVPQVRRGRRAVYADNQAARADLPSGNGKVPAFEWIRNTAEEVSFDAIFYARGSDDVEPQLQLLDDMMKPQGARGEPSDLVLVWGKRTDRVRLVEKVVVEQLWSPNLTVQQATVTLSIKLLKSRGT